MFENYNQSSAKITCTTLPMPTSRSMKIYNKINNIPNIGDFMDIKRFPHYAAISTYGEEDVDVHKVQNIAADL